MPDYFESGMFVDKPAWHRSGNVIPREKAETLTAIELADIAGLNWLVDQRPVFWQSEDGIFHPLDNWRANIRSSDQSALDVPTKDYKPIQNLDILRVFNDFYRVGSLLPESAGSLQSGQIIWSLARVPGAGFTVNTKQGSDESQLYALLASGHKSGFAFQAKFTTVRVVCWNTLSLALNERLTGRKKNLDGSFRMTHRAELTDDKVNEVRSFIQTGISSMDAFQSKAQRMADTQLPRPVVELAVIELFQPALLNTTLEQGKLAKPAIVRDGLTLGASLVDQIVQKESRVFDNDDFNKSTKRVLELVDSQPGAELGKGSAWQLLNAVTRYVDYEKSRTSDTRLTSAWFGPGDTTKTAAVDHVLSYVSAVAA